MCFEIIRQILKFFKMTSIRIVFLALLFILKGNSIVSQEIDPEMFEKIKKDIFFEMSILDKDFISKLHGRDREMALRRLDNIAYLLDSISQSYKRHACNIISPREFEELKKSVSESFTSDDKKQKILSASMNYFNVNQLIELLELVPFDDHRMEVIQGLYPQIIDPEKSFKLFDHLTFSSSKKKLEEIIDSRKQQKRR